MMWMTPAFPITPVTMDSDTDRQFQLLCGHWFSEDRYIVSLVNGIVYSPNLSTEVGDTDRLSAAYACAYEDGTIAVRWLLRERPADADPTGPPNRLDLARLWRMLRQRLLEARAWPSQTCGYGGPLRCRVGLGDVTHAVVADLPDMFPPPATAILNRLAGWEFKGEWRDAESLEEFLAGAMASLARQLQCRWYARFAQTVRMAAQS